MKYKLTFKTPDVVEQIDPEEMTDELIELLNQYIKYDEYIIIEFDLKAKTASVVPIGR